ncbi:MAG: pilus assembly protein TadG-related protein [Thermomicrobiales bacterium]
MLDTNVARQDNREEGQVIVLFALLSFVMIGALALALDVGYLLSERRAAQNAADAAALAGGVSLLNGEDHGGVVASAISYASANGITIVGDDASVVEVDVQGTNRDGRVEVEVTVPVQRFFVGAIYTGDWQVSARAVSEINDNRDGEYALIALEEPGIYVNGNMTIDVVGGSAMSNGDVARSGGANAFTVDGTIDASGSVSPNGNWEAPGGFNGNRPGVDNPFGGVVAPSPVSMVDWAEEDDFELPNCWNSDCTLQPGYYKDLGKIRIKNKATLEPGMYYFDGTSIDLQNTNSRIEGDNVTLYFDGPEHSTYFAPKNGEVNLTAPTTTPYTGGIGNIVIWIDNCTEFDSQGNNEFYLEGVLIAPCSNVWLHGNPDGETVYGQVVVGTLDVRGTSDLVIRYMDLGDTPRYELALVE